MEKENLYHRVTCEGYENDPELLSKMVDRLKWLHSAYIRIAKEMNDGSFPIRGKKDMQARAFIQQIHNDNYFALFDKKKQLTPLLDKLDTVVPENG